MWGACAREKSWSELKRRCTHSRRVTKSLCGGTRARENTCGRGMPDEQAKAAWASGPTSMRVWSTAGTPGKAVESRGGKAVLGADGGGRAKRGRAERRQGLSRTGYTSCKALATPPSPVTGGRESHTSRRRKEIRKYEEEREEVRLGRPPFLDSCAGLPNVDECKGPRRLVALFEASVALVDDQEAAG